MNGFLMFVVPVLAGYLIGSIPIAWMVCKWIKGEDIRNLGSGNVGVMNTAMSVARWAGLLVLMAEAGKGVLAVLLPRWLGANEYVVCLTVLSTVIGTRWSIWLDFAGGRGNTAGMAALWIISWQAGLTVLLIWLLLRFLFKSSFITTRLTLWMLPVPIALTTHSTADFLMGAGLSLIYLSTQHPVSDDHLILKNHWPSFMAFLISPPRNRKSR